MIQGGIGAHRRRFVIGLLMSWGCVVAGCPGTLSDPDAFTDDPRGNPECTEADVEALLVATCGTSNCHDPIEPAGQLDLASADVASRLVGVNSVAVGCTDRVLVVAAAPESSYLLSKVDGSTDICGLQMPVVPPALSDSEVTCIEDWILSLAEPPAMEGGIP